MRLSSLLLILSTAGWLVAAGPQDPVKKELKQFQGAWQAVVIIDPNGKSPPDEQVKATRMVIEGNKFTLKTSNLAVAGTFTLDPSANPKIIDVKLETVGGNKSELKMEGIYEVEGDTRKSCFYLGKMKNRPTKLIKGQDHLYLEWKREEK